MILSEDDWKTLLTRIKTGKCTPFLGAAVNFGILPLGAGIATEWADSEQYPLDSRSDLAKVSQFIAVQTDATYPKDMMVTKLNKSQKPFDFDDPDEPLNVLAKLPLSVYLTTNYDDLLFDAINHHGIATGPSRRKGNLQMERQPQVPSPRFLDQTLCSSRARRRLSSTTCTVTAP